MNKKIVLIPAGGKSSRFIGDSPKMMRTHPQGKLLIEKALETFNEIDIHKVFLITTKDIIDNNDLRIKFKQVFKDKVELIELPIQTKSSVQTIYEGVKLIGSRISLNDSIFIKDVDNFVSFDCENFDFSTSASIGYSISKGGLSRLSNKSFFKLENNLIIDFVEKNIISNYISVGTHYFKNLAEFMVPAGELLTLCNENSSELYISHVLAKNIYEGVIYKYYEADAYSDFGTQKEWEDERKKFKTIFCDFDGTLVKNIGKYGKTTWADHSDVILKNNMNLLKNLHENGSQIIITTSRPKSEKKYINNLLNDSGIQAHEIICDLNHSQRILINDFNTTNIYPTALAINVKRNNDLTDYIVDF
jgi:hypothetical protein